MFSFVSSDNLALFIVASSLVVAGIALLLAGALHAFGTGEPDEY